MQTEQLYTIYQQYPSVQTDTRKLKQGDIFFALKGGNFNGNAFAKQAIDSGATYAVIDEKEFEIDLSNAVQGYYHLILKSNDIIYIWKLVIIK